MIRSRQLAGKCASTVYRVKLAANRYVFSSGWINSALGRGALSAATRTVDPRRPLSWEMSVFSQNGEDGIIEYLTSLIRDPNRYFIEIGASDGLENNSTYLALVKRYSGLMVEGSRFRSHFAERTLGPRCLGVDFVNMMVTAGNAPELIERVTRSDPDFLSIDIDGIDYYVADALFGCGLRPKVVCVEYNSTFGPDRVVTIPYSPAFDYQQADPNRLYYGVSLAGWKNFFSGHGYEFVTTESNGVNAFFVAPGALRSLDPEFEGMSWRENSYQRISFQRDWEGQFELIRGRELVEIAP